MSNDEQFAEVKAEIDNINRVIRTAPLGNRPWTRPEIERYAAVQRAICTVWPAFLGAAAHRMEAWPNMKQALLDNAACEIGLGAGETGHVTMALQFCGSLGMSVDELSAWVMDPMGQRAAAGMTRLVHESPAKILSYVWANESYATEMFRSFLPAFERIDGCDTRYMREHVEVDGDTHAPALEVGVRQMFSKGESMDDIMWGVTQAGNSRVLYLDYIETGHINESWVR